MLSRLQRAHVAAIPYENLDIVRGAPPPIEPVACVRRVVARPRRLLLPPERRLRDLAGVARRRRHAARLGRPEPRGARSRRARTGTTSVWPSGSPPGEGDGVRWLVDVGLGDGPPYPLPLVPGTYAQDGFNFRIGPSPLAAEGWRLDHDPRGAIILVDFAAEPVTTASFEAMHTDVVDVAGVGIHANRRRAPPPRQRGRRCCAAASSANGTANGMRERDVDSAGDWWALVLDRFGLAYADLTAHERDSLWRRGACDARSVGCGRPAVTRSRGRAHRYGCSRRSPRAPPSSPLWRSTSRTAGCCRGAIRTSPHWSFTRVPGWRPHRLPLADPPRRRCLSRRGRRPCVLLARRRDTGGSTPCCCWRRPRRRLSSRRGSRRHFGARGRSTSTRCTDRTRSRSRAATRRARSPSTCSLGAPARRRRETSGAGAPARRCADVGRGGRRDAGAAPRSLPHAT